MKRIVTLVLLVLLLCGCAQSQTSNINTASFYYRSASEWYAQDTGILAVEVVTISGTESLESLLAQYLNGPLSENLISPFPADTKLLTFSLENSTATITLDDSFLSLIGIERTLACACLAKTIFSISGCQAVTILSGESTNTDKLHMNIRTDDIMLIDDSIIPQEG